MSGWTYNAPSGSPTDGPQITSIAVVFTAVALLTVLLRVYVRGFMLKSVGAGSKTMGFEYHARLVSQGRAYVYRNGLDHHRI
ncbi:hypothetical protein LB505_012265 [Fusarium chuoi]|nr:hypothetical protein LB505_012265 [Fusarium chuoi]